MTAILPKWLDDREVIRPTKKHYVADKRCTTCDFQGYSGYEELWHGNRCIWCACGKDLPTPAQDEPFVLRDLGDADVREVITLKQEGHSLRAIGRKFGISYQLAGMIASGQRRKHIYEALLKETHHE